VMPGHNRPVDPLWIAVDDFVDEHLTPADEAFEDALRRQREAGLPDIAVSPSQGRLLETLARSTGARRVLEFGTLGGYSTLWLARALPEDGRIVTFEREKKHAEVALANFAAAGVEDRIEIRVGPAEDLLATLDGDERYDFVFIDADKPNNALYLDAALAHARPGALVVVDNVVRGGALTDATSEDPKVRGSRKVVAHAGQCPGIAASTVMQTVGRKGYDGFLIAVVG